MENKKCLIVDDEEVMLKVVNAFLNTHGFACVTATSGEAALEILAKETFDIMITDIQMGGMTGIELTQRTKKLYAAMPVMVMTGFTEEYSYDQVIEAGAADFLRKPFSMKELNTRVARVIRDAELMAVIKKRGKDLEEVSTLMIAGLQDEALKKVQRLEEEIRRLKEESFFKKDEG